MFLLLLLQNYYARLTIFEFVQFKERERERENGEMQIRTHRTDQAVSRIIHRQEINHESMNYKNALKKVLNVQYILA